MLNTIPEKIKDTIVFQAIQNMEASVVAQTNADIANNNKAIADQREQANESLAAQLKAAQDELAAANARIEVLAPTPRQPQPAPLPAIPEPEAPRTIPEAT